MAYEGKHQSGGSYSGGRSQEPSVPLPAFGLKPITAELFSSTAEQCAKAVADNAQKGRNKPTQLRRFYDEVCMWDEKARDGDFEELLPFIKMLNAKAAYAKGRDLIDESFEQLIRKGLAQVDSAATLHTFKTFFEAFMGFYKKFKPS